jgi:hypothetical protein
LLFSLKDFSHQDFQRHSISIFHLWPLLNAPLLWISHNIPDVTFTISESILGHVAEKLDVNLYTPVRLYDLKLDLIRNDEHVRFLDSLESLEGQLKNRKDPAINEILVYEENQQLKMDMDSIAEMLVGIRV